MSHLANRTLENALIEIESTWAAAETARIAALKAADAAWEIAKSLRDNWRREDGDAICDFAVRAREIAVQAQSRATLSNETKICDEFVKRLIRHNATFNALDAGHVAPFTAKEEK